MKKKYLICIIITSIVTMLVFLILWLVSKENNKLTELYLTLFSTILGVNITVFGVDLIIEYSQNKKNIPIKVSMNRDIQIVISRIITIWKEMHYSSVVIPKQLVLTDLFTVIEFNKIIDTVDLSLYPNVYPKVNWFNYLYRKQTEFINDINKILDKYSLYLEPEIFNYMHNLTRDNIVLSFLHVPHSINKFDTSKGIPRPTLMSFYHKKAEKEDEFKVILELVDYLNLNKNKYNKLGYVLYDIDINISNNLDGNLYSKMEIEKLDSQIKIFNEFNIQQE